MQESSWLRLCCGGAVDTQLAHNRGKKVYQLLTPPGIFKDFL